ncbi:MULTISPECIES: arginine--tRNA ligase [unclassified Bacillus (in: firmicutes)]|uniref:arginine--tRNA ligase n=1 Tax=unclassified Bacillus (in: firmicutes) TaxID=185979 RepID=UPI0008E5D8C3|nr:MULTISPECIES: arginine--tRNA ligase [unclassified Bacillus (in: firmicutes)]SFA70841.1 arginyl-tRNA synthetase [Bacillus sp. UNCCL13]SFQ60832.1 arginyl-tRNA synthetase [Bacillus sp. cl95]
MDYVKGFASVLSPLLEGDLNENEITLMIEKPKHSGLGDYAFPCFSLAKIKRKSPQVIASELALNVTSPLFEKTEAAGGYVNVFLKKDAVTEHVIQNVLKLGGQYGSSENKSKGVVTLDMSSPNIAKPFSMGHLRSTVIGNSLSLIFEKSGYQPVKINHLGDWGTQFGKLITAYKKWGDEEEVIANPIKELLKLYIKFHDEAEKDPELEVAGRNWFKQLEDGNEEALSLWKWFREESLKDFSRIYDLLNIKFDSFAGEAFYNDKMNRVVELLEEKRLLTTSEQALVVDLESENMPPCLIKKSDGATLYATRDLAAALYRFENYRFAHSIYVVGNEQTLHFKQLIHVLKKMGYAWSDQMVHVPFGMILKDGKKMSTRKGKVILLEEVLNESIALAKKNIEEKNPNLENKEAVARMVGVGAVIFHDLKNFRMNDIDFNLEDMLRVEGETGPYVQYTYARANSLLRKGGWNTGEAQDSPALSGVEEWDITMKLLEFPEAIQRATAKYDPSQIAKYVVDLAQAFNKYYGAVRILEEDEWKYSRLKLVSAICTVLEEGLRLLGLQAPEEM